MKSTELKGLAVVNIGTGEKLGTIAEVLLDPKAEKVSAFEIETGGGGMLSGQPSSMKQVSAQDVHAIGPDAMTVQDASALKDPSGGETLALSAIMDEKVVTEGGTFVGKVASAEIDETSMSVTGLDVSAGFFKSNKMVAKADFVTIGDELIIVHDSVTAEPAPEAKDELAADAQKRASEAQDKVMDAEKKVKDAQGKVDMAQKEASTIPPTVTEVYGSRGTGPSEQ